MLHSQPSLLLPCPPRPQQQPTPVPTLLVYAPPVYNDTIICTSLPLLPLPMQLQAQAKGGLELEVKGVGLKPEEVAADEGPPKEHKIKKGRVEGQQEGTATGSKSAPQKVGAPAEKGGSASGA
eukprot:scaffold7447_cov19-Tisochrysis_lutea.AAC.1